MLQIIGGNGGAPSIDQVLDMNSATNTLFGYANPTSPFPGWQQPSPNAYTFTLPPQGWWTTLFGGGVIKEVANWVADLVMQGTAWLMHLAILLAVDFSNPNWLIDPVAKHLGISFSLAYQNVFLRLLPFLVLAVGVYLVWQFLKARHVKILTALVSTAFVGALIFFFFSHFAPIFQTVNNLSENVDNQVSAAIESLSDLRATTIYDTAWDIYVLEPWEIAQFGHGSDQLHDFDVAPAAVGETYKTDSGGSASIGQGDNWVVLFMQNTTPAARQSLLNDILKTPQPFAHAGWTSTDVKNSNPYNNIVFLAVMLFLALPCLVFLTIMSFFLFAYEMAFLFMTFMGIFVLPLGFVPEVGWSYVLKWGKQSVGYLLFKLANVVYMSITFLLIRIVMDTVTLTGDETTVVAGAIMAALIFLGALVFRGPIFSTFVMPTLGRFQAEKTENETGKDENPRPSKWAEFSDRTRELLSRRFDWRGRGGAGGASAAGTLAQSWMATGGGTTSGSSGRGRGPSAFGSSRFPGTPHGGTAGGAASGSSGSGGGSVGGTASGFAAGAGTPGGGAPNHGPGSTGASNAGSGKGAPMSGSSSSNATPTNGATSPRANAPDPSNTMTTDTRTNRDALPDQPDPDERSATGETRVADAKFERKDSSEQAPTSDSAASQSGSGLRDGAAWNETEGVPNSAMRRGELEAEAEEKATTHMEEAFEVPLGLAETREIAETAVRTSRTDEPGTDRADSDRMPRASQETNREEGIRSTQDAPPTFGTDAKTNALADQALSARDVEGRANLPSSPEPEPGRQRPGRDRPSQGERMNGRLDEGDEGTVEHALEEAFAVPLEGPDHGMTVVETRSDDRDKDADKHRDARQEGRVETSVAAPNPQANTASNPETPATEVRGDAPQEPTGGQRLRERRESRLDADHARAIDGNRARGDEREAHGKETPNPARLEAGFHTPVSTSEPPIREVSIPNGSHEQFVVTTRLGNVHGESRNETSAAVNPEQEPASPLKPGERATNQQVDPSTTTVRNDAAPTERLETVQQVRPSEQVAKRVPDASSSTSRVVRLRSKPQERLDAKTARTSKSLSSPERKRVQLGRRPPLDPNQPHRGRPDA